MFLVFGSPLIQENSNFCDVCACVCVQHRVVVPKAGKVSDLCSALSEMTSVPPTQVSVCSEGFGSVKHTFNLN